MRILTLCLALLISCSWTNPKKQDSEHPALELISAHQMSRIDSLNFDLSGIHKKGDSIIVIADKPWNTYLYSIKVSDSTWLVEGQRKISSQERFDLEAIDYCKGKYYMANEFTGSVNVLESNATEIKSLPIDFKKWQLSPESWGNAGWEGLALDCENEIMYLAKERQPRSIIVVNMSDWTIQEQFNIPQTESNDFSDAKFQNGFLYLLERNGNYITKINPKTKEVIKKYHYRHIASHASGKLYTAEKYGMAEALLLTEDEIWVGLDNNGRTVSGYARDTFGMTGNTPVILRFKRPESF